MTHWAQAAIAGREVRLGKKPAQHKKKNLSLARYVKARALPQAPSHVHYGQKVIRAGGSFPMYANDRLGDCTLAAAGHMIETWSANAQGLVTPAEQEIVSAYIPGTGNNDDGRYLNEVLDYWRTTGIGADKVYAYAEVDVKDQAEVEAALWLFGGLYLGVGLPISAQTQRVWHVDSAAPAASREPYSWGGHCVNGTGFAATTGVYLVTWGQLTHMTWAFFRRYVDEAFAVISTDWLDKAGISPKLAGALDLGLLSEDLRQIGP